MNGKGKKVIIVGAGLIGLEIADSLHRKNVDVTVIETLPSILANTLDEDLAIPVYDNILKNIQNLIIIKLIYYEEEVISIVSNIINIIIYFI